MEFLTMILKEKDLQFQIPKRILYLGIIALFTVTVFIINGSGFGQSELLVIGVTLDLTVMIPVFYLILSRKSSAPSLLTIPILAIGLGIGKLIIPNESQLYLSVFQNYILPFVAIFIVILIIYQVRLKIRVYRLVKNDEVDFYSYLKKELRKTFPRAIGNVISTEIAVFYYGFFKWRIKVKKENEYTYHKKSSVPVLLYSMVFIALLETVILHILLVKWNHQIAWIISGLSIYLVIQIFGFTKALLYRPIVINDETLTIRYGIFGESVIPIHQVELADNYSNTTDSKDIKSIHPFAKIENDNVLLTLKKSVRYYSLYGKEGFTNKLSLFLDKPQKFLDQIHKNPSYINSNDIDSNL